MNAITETKNPAAETQSSERQTGMSISAYLSVLAIGMSLGIVFVKSEVANWHRINDMFLFKEAHMYLIIGVGVVVAMISMLLIKTFEVKSLDGKPVKYKPKPYHLGVIFGGMIFGAGWAITGACPGPIYAQIGGGEMYALATLAGAMLGMFTFAFMKPRLPM